MLRHIGLCIAMLGLLTGPAMAADADLPPPDPADTIYTITLESDIPNTAHCLGDISTALCALETFIACKEIPDMRRNPICGQVGYKLPPPLTGEIKTYVESRPKDPTVYRIETYYRVHASLWPSPEMVAEIQKRTGASALRDRNYTHWIIPGDGIILVQYDTCIIPTEQACKPHVKEYMLYSLYQLGSIWRVRGRETIPNIPALHHALRLPNYRM